METEDNEMGEFIDFILTPTEKEKEKELNLSHPSVEFEEKTYCNCFSRMLKI